jgi:NAD(P)-dependent dehydrogenase (short-subunit alcohol dehydrogenase family)
MTGSVQGKVALITGAGRGQGRSHALKLAAEGADIVAYDICHDLKSVAYDLATPDDLKQTVAEVEALDRRAIGIQGDVRDLNALSEAVSVAVDTLGRLDIVCANAGIASFVPGLGLEGWAEVAGTNLARFRPDLENPTREDALPGFATMQLLPNVPYIEPYDISNLVVFLASDEARYITGEFINVDAGAHLKLLE